MRRLCLTSFLTAFSDADLNGVLNLFAPDALVWGTGRGNPPKASAFGPYSSLVLSDDAVLP